jgi:hypothetical protein
LVNNGRLIIVQFVFARRMNIDRMKNEIYMFTFSLTSVFNSTNGFVRNSLIKRLFSFSCARIDSSVLITLCIP